MERLNLLIEKYLDNSLLDAERDELARLLESDGAHRHAFFDALEHEVAMRDVLYTEVEVGGGVAALAPPSRTVEAVEEDLIHELATVAPYQKTKAPVRSAPRRRTRRSAPVGRWLAAAAVVAMTTGAVILTALNLLPAHPVAHYVKEAGRVEIERHGDRRIASDGEPLFPGDRLITGEGASAKLRFAAPGTGLQLGANADLRLGPGGEEGQADLWAGRLWAWVGPRQADDPFILYGPEAKAVVLGTKLRLIADTGSTRLDVTKGRVRLQRLADEAEVEVAAGHYAVARPGVALRAQPAGAPGRASEGLLALYLFDDGDGTIVPDVSGHGEPLDLNIQNREAVRWLPTRGLRLFRPTRLTSIAKASKIAEACRRSNALTLEAWIVPATLNHATRDGGMARIVTLSSDTSYRDFSLGQGESDHEQKTFAVRLRTTSSSANGMPSIVAPAGTVTLRELAHVVYTRDGYGRARLYVNGEEVAAMSQSGDLSIWKDYRLALGHEFGVETDSHRAWLGDYHLVAIYGRALAESEVIQNFDARLPGLPAGSMD